MARDSRERERYWRKKKKIIIIEKPESKSNQSDGGSTPGKSSEVERRERERIVVP